jgi:hypothetical protein
MTNVFLTYNKTRTYNGAYNKPANSGWYFIFLKCQFSPPAQGLRVPDVSLTNGWMPKGTVISGANAQIMKLDINIGTGRFYRIRVSDSPGGL